MESFKMLAPSHVKRTINMSVLFISAPVSPEDIALLRALVLNPSFYHIRTKYLRQWPSPEGDSYRVHVNR
ncbi:uncharacterized protein ARMOST_17988 [Armillaria ostoyae]|uniref:Uncharacterized protein n=1 Tax=Armillaria ostoyae TaxID=47428 RepID=A0A284S0H6_ARMOS|nr:uncharacterized protein ARMOST_17988 [Armillaria ostoyae]